MTREERLANGTYFQNNPSGDSPTDDPFLAHEALDRAHTLSTMFDTLLLEHAYIEANEDLKTITKMISENLAELYQHLGRHTFREANPTTETK
jgi:hypothetical protein